MFLSLLLSFMIETKFGSGFQPLATLLPPAYHLQESCFASTSSTIGLKEKVPRVFVVSPPEVPAIR